MSESQSDLNLRKGLTVISAEGRRVGKIYEVVEEDGAPSYVKIILNGKMVTVPVSTLSPTDKSSRVQTSLGYKDIG